MTFLNEQHLIVTTKAKSDALVARFNGSESYPKRGKNIGHGRHIDPTAMTTNYALGRKHPTENKWAFPVHAGEQSKLTVGERNKLTTLTNDWLATVAQP